ncbi:hypothetical protein GCM10009347_18620 [Shewanella algicola]|uniref:DUF4097 domain-containing protein n=1 Tax=Shewanella algicola TaxID=640633 RepID=A0A9X1Z7T7_9GAMM|nr:hypothetical protein [Shewanella algicola]MCL1105584.1 DUF4097 domain-containing protein [Shewanella algicola]GGP51912.1 hypothetical protein GCM10009347_18620 [Shewanella algicola]
MSIRIATISLTVGLVLGATIFGASYTEAESIFSLTDSADVNAELTHTQQKMTLDSQSLNQLVANTGAGKLTVKGVEGQTHIEVTADIYTDKDSEDVEIELTLNKQGDNAKFVADIESDGFMEQSPFIDVLITVPAALALDITDGSGSIKISDVAAAITLKDGSGSIVMDHVGAVKLADGSGSINMKDVNGDVTLQDGSGSINISQVTGDIEVSDGSGSINIDQVNGKVTISDGSGGINVSNTKGLEIVSAGSGGVNHQDIDGPVIVN